MYNILTMNKIAACGIDKFDKAAYTITDECAEPTAIMVRSAKLHDYEMPSSLLAIARAGAGVNNIPVDKCAEQGVVVFNTPGANANAVKELVICALLLASRRITEAAAWANSLKGTEDAPKTVEGGKAKFAGPEIFGKTLGVIGLGAIGGKVANAAVALGMKVIGFDPFLSDAAAKALDPTVKVVDSKDEIYKNADYITLHVPFTPDAKNSISKEQIAMMKDGVRIINAARGELVDTAAVVEAIKAGKIAKYVTDFADDIGLGEENVITLPHLGASTPESEDNCAIMAADELMDYIERGKIRNSVTFPNLELAKTADQLVCVLHKAEVTEDAVKAAAGADVVASASATKKAWGYTLLDVKGSANVDAIKAVAGVVGVRVI